MRESDPRLWAIAHPQMVLLLFVVITILMVWGNWQVQRGGMFAGDVILREDDPYRAMDRYVHEEKHHQGFDGAGTIRHEQNEHTKRTTAQHEQRQL